MRVGMRVALGLALFLGVAGLVYLFTSYEWRGSVLLLVCAVAAGYVGVVLRGASRRGSVPVTPETMATEDVAVQSEHIGPSIWPFVVSIAALLLAVGAVGLRWLLIPGVILLAGAGAGWFLDIKRQWHPGELAVAHGQPAAARLASGLEGDQQTDHHDSQQDR
jgi:Cytochrome c oxidase subunit IV